MLGLSYDDILGIHNQMDDTSRLKTTDLDFVDGALHIRSAIRDADVERTTARRAARLAVSIQSSQPFTNGNTRTATMCVYALLAVERGQWLRRKPYQVYGQVGHWGPVGDDNAVTQVATFIDSNMIGSTNIQERWNNVIGQLPTVADQVAAWRANRPIVSKELRSWYNNRGY